MKSHTVRVEGSRPPRPPWSPPPASRVTRFGTGPQPGAARADREPCHPPPARGRQKRAVRNRATGLRLSLPGPQRAATPGGLPLTSPHFWLSAARLLVAVLVAATLAALEQALRYSSIAGLGPSATLRPPLPPSLAPLSPSSSLRCDWTWNGQYPASARPHARGVPGSELGGPRKVVPSWGLVPGAWVYSAPDLGKSDLGAWSMRASVKISFLSETSTPQSHQTKIQTLKALREGSWRAK